MPLCEECDAADFDAREAAKRAALLKARVLEGLPPEVIERRLGMSGALVQTTAERLGVKLPDYKTWENVLCPEVV